MNHPNTIAYIDNHNDFSNSATNFFSKHILHERIWRYCAKKIDPLIKKWYGVLPARCDFLSDVYKISKNKISLLVMGGDDDKIARNSDPLIKKKIRSKFDINDADFLIVTGGKIDKWKTETLLLMDAVNELNGISLIIFGSVDKDIKESFDAKCSNKVKYVGWINSDESYEYFFASDLLMFLGRHSVYWEQAVSQGKPLVVKYYPGYNHIDLGGNIIYLKNESKNNIKTVIESLIYTDKFIEMEKNANKQDKYLFYYSHIAEESIM